MQNKTKKLKLVYIGCGHARMKDFIHVEINLGKNKSGPPDILADISDYIPIKSNSADLVFSRATMEHLTYAEFLNCLLEIHRTLKRCGRVRIVVPDLDKWVEDFNNKVYNSNFKSPGMPNEDYVETFVGRVMYFDHRYNHNFHTLKKALNKTGFSEIRKCEPGDSKITDVNDELKKAEEGRVSDIIVEAVKLDKEPVAKKTKKEYPKNPIAYFLAKFFNVKIKNFIERKSRFPQKYWFKTWKKWNKSDYL